MLRIKQCKSADGHSHHALGGIIIYRHLVYGEGCSQLQSLPAGGGVYTRVAPRAPRYNRVAAINHGALADGERAQPVQVVTLPRIVGSFWQRAHAGPYVVRNWDREPCNWMEQNGHIRCWWLFLRLRKSQFYCQWNWSDLAASCYMVHCI